MNKKSDSMKAWRFIIFLCSTISFYSAHAQSNETMVQEKFAKLEATADGKLGIAALNTANNTNISYHATQRFPMGCTSKVMGVAAILKRSMQESQLLQQRVNFQKSELVAWSPVTEKHVKEGMTVAELAEASITFSDNTAMNLLTKILGGPQAITKFSRDIGDQYFKVDHWWPDEAMSTPHDQNDSSTPEAMTKSMQKLAFGNVLDAPHRQQLLTWLKHNTTGSARIRAGVPKDWIVGDKTGTGFFYGITNDTAIIWPPNHAPIVVTIFFAQNKKDANKREDVLAEATRILIREFALKDNQLNTSHAGI